ncbi:FMN-binding glutamate synthase family protein [Pseudonocardia sp. N23]|uniref:FMN-binding glutamate synthase family protein n=1 Tax=Pseudonocardia sp. N23 TaxID=1987376 RepID=UPI000BFE4958|nr:FMN-binding glutamate synthase family protein [Pseudonocardia sp. N23]
MLRIATIGTLTVLGALAVVVALLVHPAWWVAAAVLVALLALAVYDVVQRRHAVLRNYPVVGHLRYLLEGIRPEVQQYFVERNVDGRPFDRDTRSLIYQRAKGTAGEKAFGTERDVNEVGYEYLLHATVPLPPPDEPHRVRIGGPDCARPYDMALLNVSAMSFGALSANAILALNKGAAAGGFAHDTGEGGLSRHHLEHGGDLVWELGSGYFGARTRDGDFDPDMFAAKAAHPAVTCVSLKLSQGAKPGLGGVLPAPKVSAEIAAARSVPEGVTCVSPSAHRVFTTPRELVRFLARMRELAGGKPTGIKLCVGSRVDVLALCKAMVAEGTGPDFVVVDGSEGGTGAAPPEYEDHVGAPLTEGLMTVHNALVGAGLRGRVRVGASGKVSTGSDIVKRLIQGADFTNSARAMMMATGCIQSQRCHTNTCPVGVATQDPRRAAALDVDDKAERVRRFQQATVAEAQRLMGSMGSRGPGELGPHQLRRRIGHMDTRSYAELFDWLEDGELLAEPPRGWAGDWNLASPDHFGRYTP